MIEEILQNTHIGIYGVIEDLGRLLVVRKTRGPYRGRLDLPGGRPLFGEPLEEALRREVQEETGLEMKEAVWFKNVSFVTPYVDADKRRKELYHIALLYTVSCATVETLNPILEKEEISGCVWLSKEALRKELLSPLVQAVIDRF